MPSNDFNHEDPEEWPASVMNYECEAHNCWLGPVERFIRLYDVTWPVCYSWLSAPARAFLEIMNASGLPWPIHCFHQRFSRCGCWLRVVCNGSCCCCCFGSCARVPLKVASHALPFAENDLDRRHSLANLQRINVRGRQRWKRAYVCTVINDSSQAASG